MYREFIQCFHATYLSWRALKVEKSSSSKTSVTNRQSKLLCILEDFNLLNIMFQKTVRISDLTFQQPPVYSRHQMKCLQPLPSYQNLSFPIFYELLPLFLMSSSYLLGQCFSTDFLHLQCNSNALVYIFVIVILHGFFHGCSP